MNVKSIPLVGISTATYFDRMSTTDTIRDYAENGVHSIELFLNSFSEYEPSFINSVQDTAIRFNTEILNIHPMSSQFEPQLCSSQTTQYNDSHMMFEKVLCAGQKLGAKQYVMHGLIDIHSLSKLFPVDRFIHEIDRLIDTAESHHIRLTLENVSWCILNCPEIAEKFVTALNNKLHYTLDVKQCFRSGYTPNDYIRILGKHITNVHLCDFVLDDQNRYHWKLPGDGVFDFESFLKKLREIGFCGPLIIETYSNTYDNNSEVFRSYQYISKLVNKVFMEECI